MIRRQWSVASRLSRRLSRSSEQASSERPSSGRGHGEWNSVKSKPGLNHLRRRPNTDVAVHGSPGVQECNAQVPRPAVHCVMICNDRHFPQQPGQASAFFKRRLWRCPVAQPRVPARQAWEPATASWWRDAMHCANVLCVYARDWRGEEMCEGSTWEGY